MVEINNLTAGSIDEKFLRGVAQIVLKEENKKGAGLSIVLIGERGMKKLNKKYRGKNRVTDILTFGQAQKFPVIPESELELGEIVICPGEVKRNSKRYKVTFQKELGCVLIHGILHLLGYNHEKFERANKEMKEKEQYYLSRVFYK